MRNLFIAFMLLLTAHIAADFSYCIDFEKDASGNPLAANTVIDDEYSSWGITFSTSDPTDHPLVIFNSSTPTGGDTDLGTPNEYYGGPGIGLGGNPFGDYGASSNPSNVDSYPGGDNPYVNKHDLGNILIISDDPDQAPNDYSGGGWIYVEFAIPVYVDSVGFLDDLDAADDAVIAYNSSDQVITQGSIIDAGENNFQRVHITASNVSRLEIYFSGSGGFPCMFIRTDNPLPVTLSSFTGVNLTNGSAQLNWVTQSESNNLGWNLYRSSDNDPGTSMIVNPSIILGAGTSSIATQYSYIDEDLPQYLAMNYVFPGEHVWYWLESNDLTGQTELFEPITITIQEENGLEIVPPIDKDYGLYPNYPNPFNPDTFIRFNLAYSSKVSVMIFNHKGQLIRDLYEDFIEGKQSTYNVLPWDGRNNSDEPVSSGIYLVKLQSDREVLSQKIILIK